ncbi:MAG: glycosyltransferase [Bacteroidia bacterium]
MYFDSIAHSLINGNKKIKICHFASVHTIVDTRVFYRECVSLAKQFDVTYIGIGNFTGERNGVKIIGVKNPRNRSVRLVLTTFKVCYLALKQDADIYHFHDAELIPFAIVLRILGKKIIYDVHENTYADILNKPWIPGYLKFFTGKAYRFLEWLASQFMPFILVIAEDEFAKRFKVKEYSIIQNYADVNELAPFQVQDRSMIKENNLFYIGTVFDYYYDFSNLVEAIYLLKQQNFFVNLHCVGNLGNLVKTRLAENDNFRHIKDQIIFHGHVVHPKGFEISKICKVGICLKNQPEEILVSHERKFFEYLAIGMPMITCNSHIYKNVIDEFGVGKYADLDDSKAVAEAIKAMLSDHPSLKQMSKNCIKAAEKKFNWESQEMVLVDFYEKVIGEK